MPDTNENKPPDTSATPANDRSTPASADSAPPTPAADSGRWRARAEEAERELALRKALAGIDWFDPDDAYRELAQYAQRDAAGRWTVSFPSPPVGEGRRSEGTRGEGERLSPAQAARELAARKPHWVRARVLGGSGAGDGIGGAAAASAGVTYADLLKPENRDKLREYLYDRPDELERLRQAHFKRQ